jgi:hypothetical protein
VIGVNAQHYSALGFGTTLDEGVQAGAITDLQLDELPFYGPESPHASHLATLAVFRCRGTSTPPDRSTGGPNAPTP